MLVWVAPDASAQITATTHSAAAIGADEDAAPIAAHATSATSATRCFAAFTAAG